jgi:hypothetical protein
MFLSSHNKILKSLISLIVIFIWTVFLSVMAAEIKIVNGPNAAYGLRDKVYLKLEIREEKEPAQFILSELKGPEAENLKVTDSKISVVSGNNEGKNFTVYSAEFEFHANALGEASISPIVFTFMNASGEKQKLETQRLKIRIISTYKKYAVHLVLTFGILFVLIHKRMQKIRKIKKNAEYQVEFKKTRIQMEAEAREEFKGAGIHLIGGEYDKYSKVVLEILLKYFNSCHPGLKYENSINGIRQGLKPFLNHDTEKKMEQFLNLLEEIQFTGKKPLSSDLDRISDLAREIIAWHREYYEIIMKEKI